LAKKPHKVSTSTGVFMSTPLSFHDERPSNRDEPYVYGTGNRRDGGGGGGGGAMKVALIVVALASLAGLIFSMTSSGDFIEHLDRQVHSIHCSLLPGAKAEVGESGGATVDLLMSGRLSAASRALPLLLDSAWWRKLAMVILFTNAVGCL
jgi:hypothetical protein